jgi:hypothetical protein
MRRGQAPEGRGGAAGAVVLQRQVSPAQVALRGDGTGRASRLATGRSMPTSNGRWGGAGTRGDARAPGGSWLRNEGRVEATMTLEAPAPGWPSWRSVAINTRSSDQWSQPGHSRRERVRCRMAGSR